MPSSEEVNGSGEPLRESTARVIAVLDDLPVGIVILDKEGRPIQWNRKFVELRGLEPEESAWLNALHPDDREAVLKSWKEAAARTEPWAAVYRFLHSNGEIIWVSGRAKPLCVGGELIGYVRTIEDITKLKSTETNLLEANAELQKHAGQLEKEVQNRTEKLQEAFAELDKLSYSIVHDMRAPLRSLRGFSDLLLEAYCDKLDAQGKDFLRRIAASAKRQDELISGVLAYHSYVRSQFPLSPINLDQIVSGILETYSNLQPPKVQVDVKRPLGWIFGHDTLLTQSISALLNNAAKFVAPGTKPEIKLWSEKTEREVTFWIEDNGIGIAPEYHQKIFDVFQRLHDSERYSGTGVGLPLAKKAVERMDGTIGVQSDIGKGARFWVTLSNISANDRSSSPVAEN